MRGRDVNKQDLEPAADRDRGHTRRRRAVAFASSVVAASAVVSPAASLLAAAPASAEAGCDHGEVRNAIITIPYNQSWYNGTHAWRSRARPIVNGSAGHAWWSEMWVHGGPRRYGTDVWYPQLYNQQFGSSGGMWTDAHYSEVAHMQRVENRTGNTRDYFYDRSCMK